MEYIFYIIVILLVIDVPYRFKKQKSFNLLIKHLAFVINHYEKILLDKKIITENDIRNTRNAIIEDVSEHDFLKLKEIVVAHDDTSLPIFTDIISNVKDYKNMLDETKNAIYMVDKQKLSRLENEVRKDNRE